MNILHSVLLSVPCGACGGSYEISASDVLRSQQLLHEGCAAATDHECPPRFHAGLVDADALSGLERAWARLEEAARAGGCTARLVLSADSIRQNRLGDDDP